MEGTTRRVYTGVLCVLATLLLSAYAIMPAHAATYTFNGNKVRWSDPGNWSLTTGPADPTGLPVGGGTGIIGSGQYAYFDANLYPPGTAPSEIVVQTGGTLEHFPYSPGEIFTTSNHNVVLDGGTFTARYYNLTNSTNIFLKSDSTLGKNGNSWYLTGTVADYSGTEAGKLTADINGSVYLRGANTYSGGTEIIAGRLVGDGAGTMGTGRVVARDGGIFNIRNNAATAAGAEVLIGTGGTYEVYGNITPNHVVVLDGGTLRNWVNHNWNFYGDVKLKSDSFIGGHTGSDKHQYFRGSLADFDATHAGKLIKVGNGILTLDSAHGYTGGTEIRGGLVDPYAAGALGTGDVVVKSGGALRLRSNTGTVLVPGGTITVEGGGILDLYSAVPTGNILNMGDGAIVRSAPWSVNINASLQDDLNLAGTLNILGVNDKTNAASMRFYGDLLEGATPSSLVVDVTDRSFMDYHIGLHGTGTFSGGFEQLGGYVEARAAGSLGTGDVIVHDGAVLDFYTGAAMSNASVLDIRGAASGKVNLRGDLTVYELILGGTHVAPGTYSVADLSSHFTGAGQVTVAGAYRFIGGTAQWADPAAWDLDGTPINGKKGIIGPGQVARFTSNLYDPTAGQTAPQEIVVTTGGILKYDHYGFTSIDHNIVLDGGTFTKNDSWWLTYGGGLRLKSDSLLCSGTTNNGRSFTIKGLVADYDATHAGRLIMDGGCELVLRAANTYSGGTEIRNGTVVADHTTAEGALGTGDVWVRSGAALELWYANRVNPNALITLDGGATFIQVAAGTRSNYMVRAKDGAIVQNGAGYNLESNTTFAIDGTMILHNAGNSATRSSHYYGVIAETDSPSRVVVTASHPDEYNRVLYLRGANTFTGGFEVTGGLVVGTVDGAFGLGDVIVHPSGRIELLAPQVIAPDAVLTLMSSPNPGNAVATLHHDLEVRWLNLGGQWIMAGTYNANEGMFADFFEGDYRVIVTETNPASIPEPATLSVLALAAGAALLRRRRG